MVKTWFIYKNKLHSIEPKIELEMKMTPEVLRLLADENMFLKRAEMAYSVRWKPYLDRKYGPDPDHPPIIISEEEAKKILVVNKLQEEVK